MGRRGLGSRSGHREGVARESFCKSLRGESLRNRRVFHERGAFSAGRLRIAVRCASLFVGRGHPSPRPTPAALRAAEFGGGFLHGELRGRGESAPRFPAIEPAEPPRFSRTGRFLRGTIAHRCAMRNRFSWGGDTPHPRGAPPPHAPSLCPAALRAMGNTEFGGGFLHGELRGRGESAPRFPAIEPAEPPRFSRTRRFLRGTIAHRCAMRNRFSWGGETPPPAPPPRRSAPRNSEGAFCTANSAAAAKAPRVSRR